MSTPCILLVDDQRDIVRLLHSTLQTLGHKLDIVDAPSGEEALLEASRRKVDLLVADYLLPGISGVELLRKIKLRSPNVKVIFISGMTDRKSRDEMINGGAVAIFDKPIPLADFLDAVERSLGLVQTIFPPELSRNADEHRQTLAELLAGLRQKIRADAVFLISDRARILARAGDLYDSSMEVSMLSALMAIYSASLKVSRFIRQENLDSYHVFRGGDNDLILIPVDTSHALLLAGKDLAKSGRIIETLDGMLFIRRDIHDVLKSLGVDAVPVFMEPTTPEFEAAVIPQSVIEADEPEVDLEALFATANKQSKVNDVDAFWNDAVEKAGNISTNPDVITFEEARKLGLDPGKAVPIKSTGPLKGTGVLKKK